MHINRKIIFFLKASGPVSLYISSASLVLGTATGLAADLPFKAVLAFFLLGAAGFPACIFFFPSLFRISSLFQAPAFLIISFSAGLMNGSITKFGPSSSFDVQIPDSAYIAGTIKKVEYTHWGSRAVVNITSLPDIRFTARLNLPDHGPLLLHGDQVAGHATFRIPDKPRNPGERDFSRTLHYRGIEVTGRFLHVARISSGSMNLEKRMDRGRNHVRQAAGRASLRLFSINNDENTDISSDRIRAVEGILRALSLGEGSAVPPETRNAFATAGLAHLLAVSGLHVGIMAAGLFGFIRFLLIYFAGISYPGRIAAVLAAPATGFLVAWVGHPPSASRAGIMAIILLWGVFLQRKPCAWTSISLAGIFLIILEPQLALRPAFQLSFAAVTGLLTIVKKHENIQLSKNKAGKLRIRTVQALEVTMAATLATAPFSAVHFGIVPLSGNIANLAGVPLTSILAPLVAFAAAGTLTFGEFADFLWLPPACGVLLLILIAECASSLPFASMLSPSVGSAALFLSACGIVYAMLATKNLHRCIAVVLTLAPLASANFFARTVPPEYPLEMIFLSVGHGDSILLRTKSEDILVDAGSGGTKRSRDAGAFHVVPALRALGLKELGAVIVSHPHEDHYGGISAVIDSFPVGAFYHSGKGMGIAGPYSEFIQKIEEAGIPVKTACRDPMPDISPALIECIHPLSNESDGSYFRNLSANDNSVVLSIKLEEISFLLTGDIEEEAEKIILSSGIPLDFSVVKAPHHGSATSSGQEFIDATGAAHVIFSSGAKSGRFDFPSAEVVRRWKDAGAAKWWTDCHGAIRFMTDGKILEVESFRNPENCFSDPGGS